ncbi:hypothetical protein [Filibacter tadaridae]|uniref:hypothetical protein n=1 Tax=Filibacter tadaridae TaxID=2483811 RepID=UPI00135AFD9D|nr:hypothetical protein [Filibacter tadaridae]
MTLLKGARFRPFLYDFELITSLLDTIETTHGTKYHINGVAAGFIADFYVVDS